MEQLNGIQGGLTGFQKAVQIASDSDPLEQFFALYLKHWDDWDNRRQWVRQLLSVSHNKIPDSRLPAILKEIDVLEKKQSALCSINVPNIAVMERARQELDICVVRYIFLKDLLSAKGYSK